MKYPKIREEAVKLHDEAGMLYSGQSYSVHLDMVYHFFDKYKKYIKKYADDTEKALWFHDVKEDCGKSLLYIASIIGEKSATIVENVTNETGENRKEKLIKTLPKIASTYPSIFLKLCDRLANITFSLEEKKKTLTSNMCNVYINEYPTFRYFLKKNSWFDEMWDELDTLVGFEDFSRVAIVKNDIKHLIDTRKPYLDLYFEDSYDIASGKYTIEEPPEIDILSDKIRKYIIDNVNILPVDFMLESLTTMGDAPSVPSIMYDDNGMFAVTTSGFQSVQQGGLVDMNMDFFVPAKRWKRTIREALIYYLLVKEEDE